MKTKMYKHVPSDLELGDDTVGRDGSSGRNGGESGGVLHIGDFERLASGFLDNEI